MRTATGKGNDARKILSFYRVNFDVSPPYHVLCDGPTIFQSLKNELYLKQALPKLLGAPAHTVVTECIVRELRSLGEQYSNAALFAKRAKRIPCAHKEDVSATECVTLRVKEQFETRLLLATNDAAILKALSRTPGTPLISIANQTKLVLRGPARATIEVVQRSEKAKFNGVSAADRVLLEHVQALNREALEAKKTRPKRKRPKGPNPLSVKKPKAKVVTRDAPPFPTACGITNEVRSDSGAEENKEDIQSNPAGEGAVDAGEVCTKDASHAQTCKGKRKRRRRRPLNTVEKASALSIQKVTGEEGCVDEDPDEETNVPARKRRRRRKQTVKAQGLAKWPDGNAQVPHDQNEAQQAPPNETRYMSRSDECRSLGREVKTCMATDLNKPIMPISQRTSSARGPGSDTHARDDLAKGDKQEEKEFAVTTQTPLLNRQQEPNKGASCCRKACRHTAYACQGDKLVDLNHGHCENDLLSSTLPPKTAKSDINGGSHCEPNSSAQVDCVGDQEHVKKKKQRKHRRRRPKKTST